MELTTSGVATLRRDPDQAAGDAEAADAALAASGDGRAFERLYRVHVARIHSLARRGTTGVRAARPRGIQARGDRQAARDRVRDVEISVASCAHGAAEAPRIMRSAECGMRN